MKLVGLIVVVALLAPLSLAADKAPSQAYEWRNVAIVGGGFVPGIIFNTKQPNLAYARTDIGGSYRWDNDAKRWIPLTDWIGMKDGNLNGPESIATDPLEPNRLYIASGMYSADWASNGAILRSTDYGKTFSRTDLPFKLGSNEDGRSIGERLAIDPKRNSVLYFGSRHDGLWKSDDFAQTWHKVDSFPVKASSGRRNGGIGWILFHSQTIYVGVEDGNVALYRSEDAGATWQPVPGQPQGIYPHHAALDADATLYITCSNGLGPNDVTDGAVWKFDTRIGQWTNISPMLPNKNGAPRFGYAGLCVDAQHPGTLVVSTLDRWSIGDDLYRSIDAGAHWTAISAHSQRDASASPFLDWHRPKIPVGHWIGDVEIDPFDPNHVLYVTGATIWGTNDFTAIDTGGTNHWTVRATGLEETAVLDLISPPDGAHLISALGDLGGFRHDDLNISPRQGMFDNPIFSTSEGVDFAELAPAVVVRVGHSDKVHGALSADGARSWQPFASEPPTAGERVADQIAASADGMTFVWSRDATPHFSKDNGKTWHVCNGLPEKARVIADRVNPQAFYAVDDGKLFISTDGAATFVERPSQLPHVRARLCAVFGHEGDLWAVAGKSGLYHSADAGATFTHLPDIGETQSIGFGKAAPGKSYPAVYFTGEIGSTTGVFRSDDAGATWTRINDDQHQYGWMGQAITGDPRIFGRVYLASNGRGILYGDVANGAHQP
jgi:photosystem II stability/assembly factor-like uncharacterized protein